MTRAVIFDFYGTLARWRHSHLPNYTTVLLTRGYEIPDGVLDAYFARWDGVEHAEHSVSESAYEAWVRSRLRELTGACGVPESQQEAVIDALRASDRDPMVAYPEVVSTLRALRQGGLTVGVCSNWGWELDPFLREVGIFELIDVAVTSARAGSRKPHPSIYAHVVDVMGVDPGEVLFVGDSWLPDVVGPLSAGMGAVHIWRGDERHGQDPPTLVGGAQRIGDLTALLPLVSPA